MPTKSNSIPLGTRTAVYTDTTGNNNHAGDNPNIPSNNRNNNNNKRKRDNNNIPIRRFNDDDDVNNNHNSNKRYRSHSRSHSRHGHSNTNYNYNNKQHNRRYRSNSRSHSPPKRAIHDKFTFEMPPRIYPYMNPRIRNARTVLLTNINTNVGALDIKMFFEQYNHLHDLNQEVVGKKNISSNQNIIPTNNTTTTTTTTTTTENVDKKATVNDVKHQIKNSKEEDTGADDETNKQTTKKTNGLPLLKIYDISILLHPRLQERKKSPSQQFVTYSNRRQSKCIAYVEFQSIKMAEIAIRRYNSKEFLYQNGIKSQYKVRIQPAVDRMDNQSDLAMEEEKEWFKNKIAYDENIKTRRRFHSKDGEEEEEEEKDGDDKYDGDNNYNYYNKDAINVPPSEFNRLVLVYNVANNVTTLELRKIFSNIGPIEKIFVPTASSNDYNDTNRAEILYQTSKHAKIAVKVLNNLTLCDNELKLTLANSDVKINVSNHKRKKNDGNVTRDDIDMLLQIP